MDIVGAETLKRMDTARFYNEEIFSLAKPFLKGDILEVGCGIGSFTEKLISVGNVTAIDIEKYYISKTKKALGKRAHVGFGDIEKGKYFFDSSKRFDSIICLNVLEHIQNDTKTLQNIYSLLRKKGTVFLLTPAHPAFFGSLDKGLGHARRYTKSDVRAKFLKAGFKVKRVYYFNSFGGLGWFLNSKLLRRKILPRHQLKVFSIVGRIPLFFEKFVKPPFGLSVVIIASK